MVKFYYLLPILMVMLALIANHLKGELDMASFLFSKLSFLVVLDLFPNLSSSYDFISKAASADEKLLPSVYFKDIHLLGEEVFIRLYSSTPLDQQPPLSLRPILFFIHGGGFCLGSVGHENLLASTFALQANVIIVSVGYRLAPKHPFPIPVEDVWTAFEFVSRHGKEFGGDVSKISVMGESAGGTLAAVLMAMNIEKKGLGNTDIASIKQLFLIYPPLEQGSMRESNFKYRNSNGVLTNVQMQYFWALYLQSDTEHRNNYTAFPMLTPREILAEFPPTTVILAKHDVLLDEGLAFRDRLKEAGVSVNSVVYNSTVHAFFSRFGPGQEALQLTIESFKKVHA